MSYLDHFIFTLYPYIALSIFLLGSLIRFDREQYTWKSDSSQMLKRGNLRMGSICFHIGILSLFATHLVGLLTPVAVYHAFGLTAEVKQMMAIVGGAALGVLCLVGLLILLHRRFTEPRIRAVTSFGDKVLLLWLLLTLSLGLGSIFVSVDHLDGHVMMLLGSWAQHIVTFRSGAAEIITYVPWIYKVHMFMGMTLFVIFPFSRLVHVWSGFGSLAYLTRAWQLVRPR
ncbi:respiratory nitrate reductase subunit gamma [Uliginosibacterium flavum]|uniref:Respiratory nitrate reductase subunit gamma n=1 Tax=Uliginosibacterium flavum TaxID=1396831 RepID=A0ABV2TR94_9RHOO